MERLNRVKKQIERDSYTSDFAVDAHGDAFDLATSEIAAEMVIGTAEAASEQLARINAAIERCRAGVYGVCEMCEGNIPKARLDALPFATRCVKCQRDVERASDIEEHNERPIKNHMFVSVEEDLPVTDEPQQVW